MAKNLKSGKNFSFTVLVYKNKIIYKLLHVQIIGRHCNELSGLDISWVKNFIISVVAPSISSINKLILKNNVY